jgi:hypothetical protein
MQWLRRNGSLVYDVPQEGDEPYQAPGREPIPNEETVRHNKETESLASQKETEDAKREMQRLTEEAQKLGAANVNLGKGLTEDGKQQLFVPSEIKAGKEPDLYTWAKDRIAANEERIAQIKGTLDQNRSNRGWMGNGAQAQPVQTPTQPAQDAKTFSMKEIIDAYPALKNKTSDEIIKAYAKQGITITP